MRLKSKYRRQEFRDGGRINQPSQDELPTEQPTEAAPPEAPPAPAVNEPPAPPQAEQPPQDDTATLALKRQIESLRQSEQLQRQQAAQPQQQPMSREQRLAEWQAQGLSPAEVQFFQNHPAMVDFPQITSFAIHRAKEAGLERGTDEHFATVEKIFNAQVEHMMREQAQAANPATQAMPKFFAPAPGPSARTAPNPSSLVSAPVSRSVPNGAGKRHTSGKVTLTASEVEAARISGLTVEAYAKQKIEYERQRETGEYRDNRDQR